MGFISWRPQVISTSDHARPPGCTLTPDVKTGMIKSRFVAARIEARGPRASLILSPIAAAVRFPVS